MPSGLRLPGFASVHSTGSENTSLATAGRRSPRLGGSSTCTTEQTSRGVLNDLTNMSAALPGLAYGKSGKPSISGQASVPVPMAAAQAPTAATRQLSACGSAEVHTHTANATAVEAEMDNAQSCSEYAGGIYSQLFRDEDSHDAFAEAATDGRGSNYDMRVTVRMRPLLPKEISERCGECVAVDYGGNQVTIGKATFAFDKVFGLDSTQEGVYEQTCLPLIEGLGAGLNATLLAYGQTSAGKTFTLGSGKSQVHEDQQGIIPRFVNALFRDVIYAKRAEADIAVRVSFVELHNEDINDLLDPNFLEKKGGTVSIRDDPLQGVIVQGMKEVNVSKPSELMRCLEQGAVFRTTASTLMNDQSSRSHAIFTVSVESRLHATGDLISARIRFADLAGSERAKKTGTVAGSERFREGININQGLLALGNVISALGDPKFLKNHVPYRDSKLTRLLQDSLGGNSRTLMIACVSPADAHFGETLNTLQYANRAKNIKNKVVVNLHLLDPEITKLKEVIQELQIELSKARQVPQQLGNGDAAPVAAQEQLDKLQTEHKKTTMSLGAVTDELKTSKGKNVARTMRSIADAPRALLLECFESWADDSKRTKQDLIQREARLRFVQRSIASSATAIMAETVQLWRQVTVDCLKSRHQKKAAHDRSHRMIANGDELLLGEIFSLWLKVQMAEAIRHQKQQAYQRQATLALTRKKGIAVMQKQIFARDKDMMQSSFTAWEDLIEAQKKQVKRKQGNMERMLRDISASGEALLRSIVWHWTQGVRANKTAAMLQEADRRHKEISEKLAQDEEARRLQKLSGDEHSRQQKIAVVARSFQASSAMLLQISFAGWHKVQVSEKRKRSLAASTMRRECAQHEQLLVRIILLWYQEVNRKHKELNRTKTEQLAMLEEKAETVKRSQEEMKQLRERETTQRRQLEDEIAELGAREADASQRAQTMESVTSHLQEEMRQMHEKVLAANLALEAYSDAAGGL